MNRFIIIGRLGVAVFGAAILAAGCALAPTSQSGDDQELRDDRVQMIGFGNNGEEQETDGKYQGIQHTAGSSRKPSSGSCAGCGPMPDPWKNGPMPDPWKSGPMPDPWNEPTPSSSSGGTGSSSSSSSSGGSNSSSGSTGRP
jgi:hypothetical protein